MIRRLDSESETRSLFQSRLKLTHKNPFHHRLFLLAWVGYLPRDAMQSAVVPQYVVYPSVCDVQVP